MKPAELIELLRECYRDKSALKARHIAAARLVGDYDFNQTYQYVINREEIQLQWLSDAIQDRGAQVQDQPEPDIKVTGRGKAAQLSVLKDDVAAVQAFIDKWEPRLERITNARNRSMLRVILGETLEARGFFDQRVAGRTDLLGRSA